MNRKRFMLLAVALVALNSFFWIAQGGFATSFNLVDQLFGGRMIRAEVVVQNATGSTDDFLIDRGVIKTVTPGMLVLREKDNTMVTIELAPAATVTGPAGRRTSGRVLRVGMRVMVSRLANAPADTVVVEGFGP